MMDEGRGMMEEVLLFNFKNIGDMERDMYGRFKSR
jgi:hypothetical protein